MAIEDQHQYNLNLLSTLMAISFLLRNGIFLVINLITHLEKEHCRIIQSYLGALLKWHYRCIIAHPLGSLT